MGPKTASRIILPVYTGAVADYWTLTLPDRAVFARPALVLRVFHFFIFMGLAQWIRGYESSMPSLLRNCVVAIWRRNHFLPAVFAFEICLTARAIKPSPSTVEKARQSILV
jgi:hypothetical protein